MSAYLCDEITFCKITSYCSVIRHKGVLPKVIADLVRTSEDELFRQLVELNCFALEERYRDSQDREAAQIYKFIRTTPPRNIAALRLLETLAYQCAEGRAVETPLYKALRDLVHSLTSEIVHSSDEYKCQPRQ